MAENETPNAQAAEQTDVETNVNEAAATETAEAEEISYHAVEKDGQISAIWEMQGNRHLRTIDARSNEGKQILQLFTTEENTESASA